MLLIPSQGSTFITFNKLATVSVQYISLKLTAHQLIGPMAEWYKPHEVIHVTVGSIPEST